jgi:hypothetical protein
MAHIPKLFTLVERMKKSLATTQETVASMGTSSQQTTTTAVVEIPTQTVTDSEPQIAFAVSGTAINIEVAGNTRSLIPIIPDVLAYDSSNKRIVNIGKPGVFALGPRQLAIVFVGEGTVMDDVNNTVPLYVRHNRVNWTANYSVVKGGSMITLFLAHGDSISMDINGPELPVLTSLTFNSNFNRLIVSRLSTMEQFEDTYID